MTVNPFNRYKQQYLTNPVRIFFSDRVGMPFYDEMIANPLYYKRTRGLTYKIEYMSPLEYLRRIARIHTKRVYGMELPATLEDEIQVAKHNREIINQLKQLMLSGIPIDMLVLDYARNTQEGRHRAYAVYEINKETGSNNQVKVMVVTSSG